MDWKIELVTLPVTDVDRAKAFYVDQVGFNADADHRVSDDLRFVPLAEDLFTNSDRMLLRVLHDASGAVSGFTLTVNRVRDLEFIRTKD